MYALNCDQKYTNSFLNFTLHVNEYGDLEVELWYVSVKSGIKLEFRQKILILGKILSFQTILKCR